jgi:hypothetical protein
MNKICFLLENMAVLRQRFVLVNVLHGAFFMAFPGRLVI